MKQKFKWLLALVAMVASINMWGTESYLLDFTTKSSSNSNYTNTWTWTVGSLEYSITNAANSSGGWAYVKFGGKGGSSNSSTKTSYSSIESPSFGKAIESITMTSNNASSSLSNFTLNSIVLTVTNGDNTEIDKVTKTSLSNSIVFTPTTGNKWAANCSYKITINWTIKGKSNIGLQVEKVEYAQAETEPFSVTLKRFGQEDEVINNLTSTYTLPTDEAAACDGWEFKGWSTSIISSTTTAPEFVTEATATGTYYAVYSKTESGSVTTCKYEQVSLGGTIVGGKYLISTGSYTMAGSGNTGESFSPGTTEATAKEYTITTLGDGLFTIIGPDNKYIIGTDGTSLLFDSNAPSTNTHKWEYTSNGIQNYVWGGRCIKAYGTTDFRHYTTSNGTTTYLYKRVETSEITTYTTSPECAEAGKTLISYDKNTEDEVTGDIPASVEQENGVAYTVSTATLTRSGYNFVGWNTNKEATEGITTIPAASITGTAITLYAIWQAKTVQSVVVSGNPTKKNYEAGETFNPAGLTVTVNYSDESVVVTEGIDWAMANNGVLAKGQISISVTATALGKTSVPYEVTGLKVTAASLTLTWDLSIVDDELTTATEDKLEWTNAVATMTDTRKDSKSTAANNYYPGTSGKTYTSTRFYSGSVLTIAPVDNNTITKVEFTATSNNYATALKNSTWTNATSGDPVQIGTSDSYSLTVTPTDGTQAISATIGNTCGFSGVTVYYQPGAELASIAIKTAPSKVTYNAGESFDPTGLVITATYDDASIKDITYDANDTKWEFIPELTEKLTGKDDAVAITYNGVTIDPFLDITVNRIASNLAAVSATKILVVNDMPDVSEWYTIAANYDGTVAFSSDNTDVFDAEEGTGLAYAAGSATLTITAPQTDTYAAASVTVDVTVNAAAVPCSVKWMNNGEEYTVGDPSTTVNAGQKVTKLPTAPAPCDDQHKFMGWTNNPIATPQADAPCILFTDAASAPTVDADNTVYYAVYAVESIDEDIDSYTFAEFTSAKTVEFTTDGDNTITMNANTGTNPAWNAGASEARLYAKGSMTVSSSENITKIVYSYTVNANSKGASPTIDGVEGKTTAGTWDSENKTWTGSDTEVTFSTSGSAGNIGFTNVTIYTGGGYKYSDYSTTCAAVELDAIALSGTYPTTFLLGDEFSHQGMMVTASYKNSATTKVVTNLATFSGYDANKLGEQTITVSYTEGEDESAITKTATYNVTVNDWPSKTIQEFITAKGVKCYLTAFVSNLDGNNYDLTDNSGTIHGYKYTLNDGVSALANGDRIRVKAEEYEYYQSKTHEVKNIVVVEKLAFSAIEVSETMSVTEYTEGNTLSAEGLVVNGKYADEDEATHVITEGITWNMPTAVLGTSEYDVTATVGTLTSPAYHVTGITVNAAKVLTGITIVTEPKKTFWVGENFSTTGIHVTASYDGAEDADVTALCSFSRAEAQITDAIVNETITVSYTEGTETKTATYTINANWMTLADLVENVTPTETAVKVWVKITDALVKVRNNSYLTTDVTYGDSQTKEVKIYKSGVDAAWVAGGTISGELKDVDWKLYGSDWELMPSDWNWATYTPAAPPAPDFTLPDKAAGAYATICLPGKIDHVENATLFHISHGNINKVEFEEVTNFTYEPAGMPYLVQVTETGSVKFFCDKNETTTEPVSRQDANGFVGSLQEEPQDVPNNNMSLLVSGGQLHLAAENCHLTKNHAYIDVNNVPASPIKAPNMAARRVTLYNPNAVPTNLNGLNGTVKPMKVLRDGQLYIIRDGKTYNAQGIEL